MRLPADATLIVVGAGEAMEAPRDEPHEANIASLVAAWRKEGLPVVSARVAGAASAFAEAGLERLLDDSGATTLVLCGALAGVEPTARDAESLGYHVFIPIDACGSAAHPADAAIAALRQAGAVVVDTAAALAAATTAKARQRREAERNG